MRVGFSPQFNFYRVDPVARNMQRNSSTLNKSGKEGRADSVSISPQGKAMSMLDSLIKQKEQVNEQKNKLIASTIENGDSMSSIKTQLETYEEQLKGLDEQIKAMTANQLEKQTEKNKVDDQTPKTEEEINNERLSDIAEISSNISLAKSVSSIKNKMEGEAKVLRSEIKQDGGVALKSKTDRIFEIEGRLKSLDSQLFGRLENVVKASQDNSSQTAGAKEENSSEKDYSYKNLAEDKSDGNSQNYDKRLNNKQFFM